MNGEKYIGLDVHQATISVAVLDHTGKLVMECILETKAATILEFFAGLRGALSVTFEGGTSAAWLYDLLSPHVARLVVCNPRKNALLKQGNQSDRIDAGKLAELFRRIARWKNLFRHSGMLRTVTCAASTKKKRINPLPCLLICPSLRRSPLESCSGTRPR